MRGKTKAVLITTLALLTVSTYAVIISVFFPSLEEGSSEVISSDYSTVYGVNDGNIVELVLSSPTPKIENSISAPTPITEAVRTTNYTAYLTDEGKFYKAKTDGETSLIETETPAFYSLEALKDDRVLYLISRTESLLEEGEHAHEHEEGDSSMKSEPHDIYYSDVVVLNLEASDAAPTVLIAPDGQQLKADKVSVSPDGAAILVTDLNGEVLMYSDLGEHMQTLPLKVSKVGFLDKDTLWYSDYIETDEGEDVNSSKDQHVKLFDLTSSTKTDLYETNPELSKMSVLDIQKVGEKYIMISNSYKDGSPKQIVFSMNEDFTELEGVVTLSSLSLNSNGKITPISDSEYLVDVRSSVNQKETGTFRIFTNGDEIMLYENTSQIFTPLPESE